MGPVLELTELDCLIDELDTRLTEVVLEGRNPDSSGVCSLIGCSDNDSYWRC